MTHFFCRPTSLLVIICLSCSVNKPEDSKLLWAEEFSYDGLPDSAKWGYEVGMLRNNEAQYYTRSNPKNARVSEGVLVIEAVREKFDTANYTSASLITKNKKHFLYGRIEVRAKLPLGRGTWPAAWLLGESIDQVGWPACGEIDIMEHVGFDSVRIHANVHTEAYNHVKKTNKGNSVEVEAPWEDFHTYAIEWRKDKIDFFMDQNLYFTFRKEKDSNDVWPFDKPHYLILNLAIGGGWGGQKGIDAAKFPHRYIIDYVRVYDLD
jgi:beta-glucanase (GH16 family)